MNYYNPLSTAVSDADIACFNLNIVELTRRLAQESRFDLLEYLEITPDVATLFAGIPAKKTESPSPVTLQPFCELRHGRGTSYWSEVFAVAEDKKTVERDIATTFEQIQSLFLQIMLFSAFKEMKVTEFYTGASESVIKLFLQADSQLLQAVCNTQMPIMVLRNGDNQHYWQQIIEAYYFDSTESQEAAAYHAMILHGANQLPCSGSLHTSL